MEQPWLDSLSEDWVSESRSSGSPESLLPSLSNSTSVAATSRSSASRKPLNYPQQHLWAAENSVNNSPLSERSLNEYNIPLSQRAVCRPSKLRTDISGTVSKRQRSRTFSVSSAHTADRQNTIQHKSLSLTSKDERYETPEWKRRLLRGDVAYGEQRDLFSPGGLETIFCPPPQQASPLKSLEQEIYEESMALPSSPPFYKTKESPTANQVAAGKSDVRNHPDSKQRILKYRLSDESTSGFSAHDLSKSSHFRPSSAITSKEQTQEVFSDPGTASNSSFSQCHHRVGEVMRANSGQSVILNEELSPIYVSRHGTVTGMAACSPSSLPAEEQTVEDIRDESLGLKDGTSEYTSPALPGEVPSETEGYAQNGRFANVNFRRGGNSHDDSFQRRMLSPSSLPPIDESAMLPEESMQASTPKQLPGIKKTRPLTEPGEIPAAESISVTPFSSPPQFCQDESKASPLKLFGTYDTFTNQKLLRRLSQFEGSVRRDGELDLSSTREMPPTQLQEAFVADGISEKDFELWNASRKFVSFGEGDLDNFQFSEEASHDSSKFDERNEDKENVAHPILDPSTQTKFEFRLKAPVALRETSSEDGMKYVDLSRSKKKVTTITRSGTLAISHDTNAFQESRRDETLETPRKRNGGSEGKRLLKSPLKDPTPKRRRTLHKFEATEVYAKTEVEQIEHLHEAQQQIQYVISKKRKDARHDDDLQAAKPNVLAMRQILRPRTPSQRGPSHERRPQTDVNPTSLEQERISQERKIAKVQAELDLMINDEVLQDLKPGQTMHNESRKGSVTTQDFLDEAKKIMAGIRGKARPRTGLTSVEESELEDHRSKSPENISQDDEPEDSFQDSTKEPFSRPPSREGGPVSRLPVTQQDPEILDHLRKYQEISDMDDVIASSMKSIAMAKEAANTAREIDRMTDETISRAAGRLLNQATIIESEPPNVRIIENPELQRKRKHSTSSAPSIGESTQAEFPSQGSNGSSTQSTARSIPTSSSRGSDSRRVIAPHTVSHLIPKQLAGMVFDRERNIWFKGKTIVTENGEALEKNIVPSDGSDEDPFGDIPDLSVDETQELQRIRAVAAKRKEDARKAETISHQYSEASPTQFATASQLAKSAVVSHPASIGVMSLADGQATIEMSSTKPDPSETVPKTYEYEHSNVFEEFIEEEVEREISINEDRVYREGDDRRRNVTISFSSPIASIIEPHFYDDGDPIREEPQNEASDHNDDDSNGSVIITTRNHKDSVSSSRMRSVMRSSSRRLSLGGHKFSARPVSRIDEREEENSNEKEKESQANISILVTRSANSRQVSGVVIATPRPSHEIGNLSLTPLSDFTVRQADESFGLEVSYIRGHPGHLPGQIAKRTLSRSIKELVERLTEVEPFEPFWEHMQQIDLRDKRLNSLHKLEEFCEKLEELDVSNNQISQLNGAPHSLRNLRITQNYLSDLTAWGHLTNLQYVDLSNNELESLSSFSSLVHLRGLRADNNKIKSLDGIGHLDGLLNLRLRGNAIEEIDFKTTKLKRLTDLDLEGNQIRCVRNIHELRCLSTLDLENNKLPVFLNDGPEVFWAMKYLKLSGNELESIDVSHYPNLRLLYLDRNRLGTVQGLLKTKHLDSLSIREQGGASLDPAFFPEALEVRKLFLSGNLLRTFDPRVDFLNLQYLELANCGLESLPADFGQMVPNTRVLNLNFNALRDIKPLIGIVRLKKLHLVGNRLSRLRKTTNVLAQFPSLTLADLRGNPLTLGFYPPVTETQLVLHEQPGIEQLTRPEPFALARADRIRDGKYASCLDMETKMLRRVYELLVLGGCPQVKSLDGLQVDQTLPELRDAVWEALRRADVLYDGEKVTSQKYEQAFAVEEIEALPKEQAPLVIEQRWGAEDSFA